MVVVRGDGANVTPWRLVDEELLDNDYDRYKTGKIDDDLESKLPRLRSFFRQIQLRNDLKNEFKEIGRDYYVHVVTDFNGDESAIGVIVKENDSSHGKYAYLTVHDSILGSSVFWVIGYLLADGRVKRLGGGQTDMLGFENVILAVSITSVFDLVSDAYKESTPR